MLPVKVLSKLCRNLSIRKIPDKLLIPLTFSIIKKKLYKLIYITVNNLLLTKTGLRLSYYFFYIVCISSED